MDAAEDLFGSCLYLFGMNYVNVAVLVTAQLSEFLRVRPAFDKLSLIQWPNALTYPFLV